MFCFETRILQLLFRVYMPSGARICDSCEQKRSWMDVVLRLLSDCFCLSSCLQSCHRVDLSTAPHRPIEEVQTEPVLNALRDTRKNRRCKAQRENLPAAHLLISRQNEEHKRVDPYPKAVTIDWDEEQSYRNRMDYQKGKLLVMEAGFYYVYTNICFRFYNLSQSEDSGQVRLIAELVRNAQLIQYVYRDSIKQTSKAQMLMKTGSTMRWHNTTYSMYCSQQGRGVRLDKGDALFVNVSNSWMLDREGEGTYFGAIKLGN
uniref:THD domain-containing protein n=1 Tax=Amphiprion ocellaris TaxID=80972 RepID=A0A3Q1B405_AMPOC